MIESVQTSPASGISAQDKPDDFPAPPPEAPPIEPDKIDPPSPTETPPVTPVPAPERPQEFPPE